MQKITSILAIALLCLVCLAFADKLNDPKLISAINRDPQGTWRARSYPQFEGKTAAEISHLFGALSPLSPSRFYSKSAHKLFSKGRRDIPESFDSYERWPHYIHPIREQGSCGSWWAFSSSSMLSDRFAITTNGTTNVELSPQYMVSCDKDDQGCEGGDMDSLWKFLSTNGTVSENCSPYVSGSGLVPVCNKYCVDRSKMKFYKADEKSIKYFGPRDLQGIQEDIMQHGPIVTEFKVYLDFVNYASGVYRHESGKALGRLAVKVTGWGVDSVSGLPYWIAANSWGTEWGQNGFFWILRGKNECQIEVNFYTALPLLE